MTQAANKASAIYGLICKTSEDRPRSGNSIDEVLRRERAWQDANPALILLKESDPDVLLSFLVQSLHWLTEQRMELVHFSISATIADGVQIALKRAGMLTDPGAILKVLSAYRQSTEMARMYFPILPFLAAFTRAQINPEIRSELRRIFAQFAPSASGKTNERSAQIRERILELTYIEGEKQLDSGRGPWSQIVFDELGNLEPIGRSGWLALLEHCGALGQTVPNARWKKRTHELILALGEQEVAASLRRWLDFGPTPGQPPEARSPIEDSRYQKGVLWCLSLGKDKESAVAIAEFGLACLRKIKNLGAVSQKVGFACIQGLGQMDCEEAVRQLARLRARVRYVVALRLIEKSLLVASERNGITPEELEDRCIPDFDLDAGGEYRTELDGFQVSIHFDNQGNTAINWQDPSGKRLKSAPVAIRKKYPAQLRGLSNHAKEIRQAFLAQKVRLESSLARPRTLTPLHWQAYFIDHALLGRLGRRLIWVFSNSAGSEHSGIWQNGRVYDASGNLLDIGPSEKVRLWHPLSSREGEIQAWRKRISSLGIQQPFPQAEREIYKITPAEQETKFYSNRFAGKILRQHQLASLCRERLWNYRLMGAHFDGYNAPTKELAAWNMHATFHTDLLTDRNPSLSDSGFAEETAMGINLFVASDQVRFYRDAKEISLDEVPAVVYSEVMRDVDLFTSVCSIGDDETWQDQGDLAQETLPAKLDLDQLAADIAKRADMLSRVLAGTAIADRCTIFENCLEVRGQLGSYRILFWSGAISRTGDEVPAWINIPTRELAAVSLDDENWPVELDHRTESILRKAVYLAEDWKITSPEVIKQLMSR